MARTPDGLALWRRDPLTQWTNFLPFSLPDYTPLRAEYAFGGKACALLRGFCHLGQGEAARRHHCVHNMPVANFIQINARQSPGATLRWLAPTLEGAFVPVKSGEGRLATSQRKTLNAGNAATQQS